LPTVDEASVKSGRSLASGSSRGGEPPCGARPLFQVKSDLQDGSCPKRVAAPYKCRIKIREKTRTKQRYDIVPTPCIAKRKEKNLFHLSAGEGIVCNDSDEIIDAKSNIVMS
jgi:hypothetical protein